MSLDLSNLMFYVSDRGEVELLVGPMSMHVCDDPSEFPAFIEALIERLRLINEEIQENYGQWGEA